jgi:23S rRNA pseudouridine2605 synthase
VEGGKVLVRLNKYLSMCGVASRRKADKLILEGRVKVNGLVVKELGWKIDPEKDTVEVDGKVVKPPRFAYIALYKPCCYLTALGKSKDGKENHRGATQGLAREGSIPPEGLITTQRDS